MLHKIVMWCATVLLWSGCKGTDDPARVAVACAQAYYEELLEGRYKEFVQGTYHDKERPESYEEQLRAGAAMLHSELKNAHGGVVRIEPAGCQTDTSGRVANVFLRLVHRDSSRVKVCVPMVCADGTWYMR